MRLDFLHPALLGGLLLGLLPLLIHLISRRKATTVRFAALDFVLRSTRRRARRIRLRQLLLLLLRTALLVGLALAVAGPHLVARDQTIVAALPSQVLFCLDASASMQTRTERGSQTLFELAKQRIETRVRALDPSVPAALYLAQDELTPLIEPASFDRGALLKALDAADVSNGVSELGQCAARAQELKAPTERPGRSALVVVTDGAAHAWTTAPLAAGELELELLRVPAADAPRLDNSALTELRAEPSALAPADTYDVHFQLRRASGLEARADSSVVVTLHIDERPVSTVTVTLAPDGSARKRFMQVPVGKPPGSEVTLEVQAAPDRLPLDDRGTLPLELPRLVQVLVIDGDPQTVHYRDEVFYLERALSSEVGGRARLASKVVHAERVSAPDVAGADVVLMANVEQVSAEVARAIQSRVQSGGGLLISAGDKVDAEFYNGSLAELLPSPLRGAKSSAPLDDPKAREILSIEVTTPEHPIFASFGDVQRSGLARARTHTLLLVDPSRPSERLDLMRFSNGAPALMERRVEGGRVLLLCTSIDRDWSDLAIRPGFLPLIQQSLLYLADALQVSRERSFAAGSEVPLRAPRDAQALLITGPDQEEHRLEIDPEQEPRFVDTGALGLYRVSADMGGAAARALPGERFAVHVDARESATELLDLEALQAGLPVGITLRQGGAGPKRERPLWPYLLALLALLAIGEAAASRSS